MTHIMPEVLAFISFIVFAVPLPLNSLLILMIDLCSEIGPALSFAFEPPEGDLMLVPPRKVLCLPKALPPPPPPEVTSRSTLSLGGLSGTDLISNTAVDARAALADGRVSSLPQPAALHMRVKEGAQSAWRVASQPFRRADTGESLVDVDLLFWSFCQGGVIEAAGCFAAYFVTLLALSVPLDMIFWSVQTYWQVGAPAMVLTDGTIVSGRLLVGPLRCQVAPGRVADGQRLTGCWVGGRVAPNGDQRLGAVGLLCGRRDLSDVQLVGDQEALLVPLWPRHVAVRATAPALPLPLTHADGQEQVDVHRGRGGDHRRRPGDLRAGPEQCRAAGRAGAGAGARRAARLWRPARRLRGVQALPAPPR